jgi:TonB family protein
MARMHRILYAIYVPVFTASCLIAQTAAPAPMPTTPAEILQLARTQNDIDVDGIMPWHLKATFQLFDEKGKPKETATLDEIWAGPKRQKRIWLSPSFRQIEIVNQDGTFRSMNTDEVPLLLQQARQTIVHPMPSEDDVAHTQLIVQKQRFGKVNMNCIMLAQPIRGLTVPPLGLFSTYCFDMDKPIYRIGFEYGDTTYVANSIGTFQDRSVAVKDAVSVKSVPRVTGTVDDLHSLSTLDPQSFVPSPDATDISVKPVSVSAGVAAGRRSSGSDPIYPASAKENHVQGTIILRALIGRDGHIHSLRIVAANDADLAVAAIAAVRHWTYTPYTLNGVATEVDTQITVNFKMSF